MSFQKNDFMWVFIILAGIILTGQIISSIVLYSNISDISGKVQEKLNTVDSIVGKFNEKLSSLNELDDKLNEISERLANLEKFSSNNMNLSLEVANTKRAVQESQRSLTINNISQVELNAAINDAVNNNFYSWKTLGISIIINIASLISLGGISLGIYLIFKKKEVKNEC